MNDLRERLERLATAATHHVDLDSRVKPRSGSRSIAALGGSLLVAAAAVGVGLVVARNGDDNTVEASSSSESLPTVPSSEPSMSSPSSEPPQTSTSSTASVSEATGLGTLVVTLPASAQTATGDLRAEIVIETSDGAVVAAQTLAAVSLNDPDAVLARELPVGDYRVRSNLSSGTDATGVECAVTVAVGDAIRRLVVLQVAPTNASECGVVHDVPAWALPCLGSDVLRRPADGFVGMSEEDALILAEQAGYAGRVVGRDGQCLRHLENVDTDRLSLFVVGGKVVAAGFY